MDRRDISYRKPLASSRMSDQPFIQPTNHDEQQTANHDDQQTANLLHHDKHSDSDAPTTSEKPSMKSGGGSTKLIIWYTVLTCLPMLCFSAVLLGLVIQTWLETVDSTDKDLVSGGFYLVDYPTARLIFISSWSSSVAPRLISIVMFLYLFRASKMLLRRSAANGSAGLPTPYQLGLLVGLTSGSLAQLWKYMVYGRKHKFVSLLKSTGFLLVVLQLLSLAIFAVDSLLHFTTESVPYMKNSTSQSIQKSFGQGLARVCTSAASEGTFYERPCTFVQAGTGEGLYDSSETSATFNDLSTQHRLLNATTSAFADDGSNANLVFLGPAESSVPSELQYTANTIGVTTSCEPISRICQLSAPIGASTPFDCSTGFNGDLQSLDVNSTALYWEAKDEHFVAGADFFDANFTKPYNNYSVQTRGTLDVSEKNLPNNWYLAVAARLGFGINATTLRKDPEITTPIHGGAAFILRCRVATYDVKYTSFNGTITDMFKSLANGSVAWLHNSVMAESGGSVSTLLNQGTNMAAMAASADELADTWGTQYSRVAVSVLASVFEGRSNLAENTVRSIIVTRVPRVPVLAIVVLNVVFAVIGLVLGCIALAADSKKVSAVTEGLSIEGLVAFLFEDKGGMVEGADVDKCFDENTGVGDSATRLGLHEAYPGQWEFIKKSQ